MPESKRVSRTDWAKVDATTDEDIARHMVEDDSPELTDEGFDNAEVWDGNTFLGHGRDFKNGKRKAGRPKGSGTKELVTLRIDRDILDRFRSGGPGWQTRLNDVLRVAVTRVGATALSSATAMNLGAGSTNPKQPARRKG